MLQLVVDAVVQTECVVFSQEMLRMIGEGEGMTKGKHFEVVTRNL